VTVSVAEREREREIQSAEKNSSSPRVVRSIIKVQKSQTWLIKVLAILLPLQYVRIAAKWHT